MVSVASICLLRNANLWKTRSRPHNTMLPTLKTDSRLYLPFVLLFSYNVSEWIGMSDDAGPKLKAEEFRTLLFPDGMDKEEDGERKWPSPAICIDWNPVGGCDSSLCTDWLMDRCNSYTRCCIRGTVRLPDSSPDRNRRDKNLVPKGRVQHKRCIYQDLIHYMTRKLSNREGICLRCYRWQGHKQ
jgi:hypothetical protein